MKESFSNLPAIHLTVPYFKQDTEYTCGPTSLQMLFAYFHHRASEAALADRLHTDPDIGTMHQALIDVALSESFHVLVNDQATLENIAWHLSRSIPVMVHYRDPVDGIGHYGVVVGCSPGTLCLHDPWHGADMNIDTQTFLALWECDVPFVCSHWLMAISPTPFPLGHQYHPQV